ncbi:GTP-binding protein TypA [Candidatus Roizmanbacteria bacterium RIFCSPHIGHO2_02_FULL_37_13b]|uniref:50S ribosomal subunit assembly factor BipA n=1 Tax=Candidatus Roizmanbacteria bacterium RIFCSPLOWO2_02_FULL_36_11 TaxID=1802071 RepID=A0A1F7JG46_9BACT|nr:MAG: GTP-binding protein TypA [Candidatus Roizmanbacteria bacterium RIFCSPHIGHO2_02_FULL_37_13b]OGK54590.1 MAG: GTP-binding protein TypA [Candidatus Roizmanbacteria bacterium RIFCSPLOWO2_02_FULL_36_11]
MDIYNIAIIAHVDHGKTTLVDGMLKQTHTFRDNQKEMNQVLIMDSNDLEREKGITILSKNTSVCINDKKINIIDTPGHADFGGEVERVLNMASGAILLVDAAEGPLPQTRFVLKKALEAKLAMIVIINKIDKKDARPLEVLHEVESLFLELVSNESALHFKTLFGVGRDGKMYKELPAKYTSELPGNLNPLFELIIESVPNATHDKNKPFQMLISTLDYDNYVGRLCIGKVNQGMLKKGGKIALIEDEKLMGTYTAMKLFTSVGLIRTEVDMITCGDIVAIAGIAELNIGQTVTDPHFPISLPNIEVEEPTIKITIGPNTSPFSGKEGTYTTSRQIRERLVKEIQTNLGLKMEESDQSGSRFTVSGRGELHLAILIETMRREGYELEVSKPQVIYKTIDGKTVEPYEEVTIDINKEYLGVISQELGKRKGELQNMTTDHNDNARLVYKISSQNLIGIRSSLLTNTRGTVVMNSFFLGYEPKGEKMDSMRSGALIASQSGTTFTYGLANAQERGTLFVGPGIVVYEGMIVGITPNEKDIEVNVCKAKKLTNNRSSGEGVSVSVEPPTILSLEQCLDFLNDDELLEVTPKSLRLRKTLLSITARRVESRMK